MIQDARSGPLADLDTDVVIVGAGAAGITLALELEYSDNPEGEHRETFDINGSQLVVALSVVKAA